MTLPRFVQGNDSPFRALKHYNFRVFWFGQMLSLIGSWMQGIAQQWLILILADPFAVAAVLKHGGSATNATQNASAAVQAIANRYQGEVSFWSGFPVLALVLFAGVIIDRVNKRQVILITQVGFLLCALALGILIHTGTVTVTYVMILAALVGLFMAFDMPTRQSFVVEMVGKRDVPSAVALNSSMFNAARSIGPGVAGLLLTYFSIATVFFLNAASYVIVIASLLMMRGRKLGAPIPQTIAQSEQKLLDNLQRGIPVRLEQPHCPQCRPAHRQPRHLRLLVQRPDPDLRPLPPAAPCRQRSPGAGVRLPRIGSGTRRARRRDCRRCLQPGGAV